MSKVQYIPYSVPEHELYYDFKKIDSFNLPIRVIIGSRGRGKTCGAKIKVGKAFHFKKDEYAFIRNSESELDELTRGDGLKFFEDTRLIKPYLDGKIESNIIKMDNKKCGYLLPMSTFHKFKGTAYASIKRIIIDELVPEKSQVLRGDRAWQFINTLETIVRLRENVIVYILSNALNRGDEIINLLGIQIKDYGFYVNREKGVVLHYVEDSKKFIERKDNSLVGRLIRGTIYGDNIIHNRFDSDNELLFDIKPVGCKLVCILCHNQDAIRVYFKDGKYYVTNDFNPNTTSYIKFVNNLHDVDTQKYVISKELNDRFIKAFDKKNMLFENDFVLNTFVKFITKQK